MIHEVAGKIILVIDTDFIRRHERCREQGTVDEYGEHVDLIICSTDNWYGNDREIEKCWLPCLSKRGQLILLGGPEKGNEANAWPIQSR